MIEIVINSIESISDLAMFAELYKKGNLKLNISKLAKELNKDRKTVQDYLKGKIPSGTRVKVKYLGKYRDIMVELLTDKYRSFDYIYPLYNYKECHNLHYSKEDSKGNKGMNNNKEIIKDNKYDK